MTTSRRTAALDTLRLAESAAQSAFIVALVLAPSGLSAIDDRAAVMLAAVAVVLTSAAYAFHVLTFDSLRLTGGRRTANASRRDHAA